MSADTTPVDDRAPERPADPHGIIPESFWEHYDSLREAEQAPSTSESADEERCPECLSARVREKRDHLRRQPNRREETYKCLNCGSHTDTPLAPGEDHGPGRQIELGEVDDA